MDINEKIARFIRWEAEKLSPEFQYKLAKCYLELDEETKEFTKKSSWNTAPENFLRAFHWLTKAAEKGFSDAQYALGRMYEFGWRGEAKDEEKAVEWYNKAAEQGCPEAVSRLKELSADEDEDSDDID